MPKKMTRTISVLLATLAALILSACSDVNEKNELTIRICDSPADYSKVDFIITNVDVRSTESDIWTPMILENSYIALMDLINGKTEIAAQMIMPIGGRYDAVRFTFSPENATLKTGNEIHTMIVDPEDAVVEVGFGVITMDGTNIPLLFDIDAASSVVMDATATDTVYRLRPQITFIDGNEYGAVEGGLQAGEEAVSSKIWMHFTNDDTGEVSSTYSSLSTIGGNVGAFFIRLTPGEYTLVVEPSLEDELKPYTAKVSVPKQGVLDLGVIVLETTVVEII